MHWTRAAVGLLLALVVAAGGGCTPSHASDTIRIVASLPMSGPVAHQGTSMDQAIRMAVDEAGGRAGPYHIEYMVRDDSSAATGNWEPELERRNAEAAASDADVCVYLGPYNSGAAQICIPILNQAHVVVVSPATTYPGLTRSSPYDTPGEPEKYYPTGVRTFCRLAPTDLVVGRAEASWAASLGVRSVYVVHARDAFGRGLAGVFADTCRNEGLAVTGPEGMDPARVERCARRVAAAHPDLVYFSGITQDGAGLLLRRLRELGCESRFMGPGGIKETAFIVDAGKASEGALCALGAMPVSKLPPSAKEWQDRFVARYHEPPEAYGIYAYEAARMVLDRIASVGRKDRDAIRQAIMGTRDYHGLLGTWGFDQDGDTTIDTECGYRVRRYQFDFVQVLRP